MPPRFDLALIALAAALAGCHPEEPPAVVRPIAPAASRPAADTPAARAARAERAKKLFLAECSGCHGERGRGDGPAAEILTDPRPRNFAAEPFKFRSTKGERPRREDLFETVTNGLPGSFMPSFRFLSEEERWLLVDHVRGLAGIASEEETEAVTLGPEGPADPASIARGAKVYRDLQCQACHGEQGRGDGPSAKTLKDAAERPIAVRDLTKGVFRRGATAAEVAMRFETGLTGTPMPAYSVPPEQAYDLAHYVRSLAAPAAPLPSDPVERGRRVVETRGCFACHVIEGRGGKVGPSLDVAAEKLHFDWAREFLAAPRKHGKIYGYMPYRMPDLGLSADEIDGVLALFAKVAARPYPEPAEPPPPAAPEAKVKAGQLTYVLKCAECHNLGSVIPLVEVKRQGPDLVEVSRRVRHDWFAKWVLDPKAILPDSRMVKTDLTPEQVDEVRAFLWTVSQAELAKKAN
jgi:mono/diheme cytochrome c family protein